jgi:hypothetical protein
MVINNTCIFATHYMRIYEYFTSALFDKKLSIWTGDGRLGEIVEKLGLRAALP